MGYSENNKIFIRCDGSYQIGQGHVMRCLSLAKEIRKSGVGEVQFINSESDEEFKRLIEEEGFQRIDISDKSYNISEVEQLGGLVQRICKGTAIWILDNYKITQEYESLLSAQGHRIITIDDLAERSFHADMILNYHIYAEQLIFKNSKPDAMYLLGPMYALLKDQFSNKAIAIDRIADEPKQILLAMGSGNLGNHVILQFLKIIGDHEEEFSSLNLAVVASGDHEMYQMIEQKTVLLKNRVDLKKNVQNMCELMSSCDLAIAAGGMTAYELAACGVPMMLVELAANQSKVVEQANVKGFALSLGKYQDLKEDAIVLHLRNILKDESLRKKMSKNGRAIFDGKGAERSSKMITNMMSLSNK